MEPISAAAKQPTGSGDNVVYKIVVDSREVKITIPRLLNLVPPAPEDVIGREVEVQAIRRSLEAGQPGSLIRCVSSAPGPPKPPAHSGS